MIRLFFLFLHIYFRRVNIYLFTFKLACVAWLKRRCNPTSRQRWTALWMIFHHEMWFYGQSRHRAWLCLLTSCLEYCQWKHLNVQQMVVWGRGGGEEALYSSRKAFFFFLNRPIIPQQRWLLKLWLILGKKPAWEVMSRHSRLLWLSAALGTHLLPVQLSIGPSLLLLLTPPPPPPLHDLHRSLSTSPQNKSRAHWR